MGLGTAMSPFPRSGSGISGMPSDVRLTKASELGASSNRFNTAGWFVRSGLAKAYGSLVMPNPVRRTRPGTGRYVIPTRGANKVLLTLTPRSFGTDPMPPTIIWLVSTLNRSSPRPARVGIGKYSHRVPYETVIFDVACH